MNTSASHRADSSTPSNQIPEPMASLAKASRHANLFATLGILAALFLTAGAFAAMAQDLQGSFQADQREVRPSRHGVVTIEMGPEYVLPSAARDDEAMPRQGSPKGIELASHTFERD
jgi:hypothetical protein